MNPKSYLRINAKLGLLIASVTYAILTAGMFAYVLVSNSPQVPRPIRSGFSSLDPHD